MMIKVILLLMICALPYVTCSTECVVDEIAVQQNLDLEKFLGTWYEIKWIIPIYRKDITPLADYTETYKKGTGENITITAQASYEKSCDKNFSTTMYQTEDPAKMLLVPPRNVKTNIHAVPYWILKLEDTYMVTYTCDVLNEISGTCDHVSANIWSRSSTLSDDKLQQAYGIAEEACLDKMDFVDISQENDCNTASSGHEVIASHGLLWSIVLISLYIQHLR